MKIFVNTLGVFGSVEVVLDSRNFIVGNATTNIKRRATKLRRI